MALRTLTALLVAALCGTSSSCGSNGSDGASYADKCRLACDPSNTMVCATMDAAACQRDCGAYTRGLSAVCATCVTQTNAWIFALDQRFSGQSGCQGYAFPSITDTTSHGCGSVCK